MSSRQRYRISPRHRQVQGQLPFVILYMNNPFAVVDVFRSHERLSYRAQTFGRGLRIDDFLCGQMKFLSSYENHYLISMQDINGVDYYIDRDQNLWSKGQACGDWLHHQFLLYPTLESVFSAVTNYLRLQDDKYEFNVIQPLQLTRSGDELTLIPISFDLPAPITTPSGSILYPSKLNYFFTHSLSAGGSFFLSSSKMRLSLWHPNHIMEGYSWSFRFNECYCSIVRSEVFQCWTLLVSQASESRNIIALITELIEENGFSVHTQHEYELPIRAKSF